MAANYHQSYVINAPVDRLLNIIRDVQFAIALNIEMKSENHTPNCIWFRFHHGMSFTSWAEKITITLSPISPTHTNVDILSECGMPTQIVDWGKNCQNVCNIFEYIEAHSRPVGSQYFARNGAKFCFNCGAQTTLDAAFCNYCGTKLN